MTALVVLLLWAVPVALGVVALDRHRRARRTRRQTLVALGLVPELAGTVPCGTAERAAIVAAAVATRLGSDPSAAAGAARLHGLRLDVLTESGICPEIGRLVRDAANAPRGRARGPAATVRVAHDYARWTGDDASQTSGALFRTLVEHPSGDERRAAAALVHLVQGGTLPA